VTHFLNSGTHSIPLKRLELKTSNLACKLFNRGTNEKCKIRSSRVLRGSYDLPLKFWDPLHISGRVEARNYKFGMQIEHEGY